MGKGRDNKDNAMGENDNAGNKENNDQSKEGPPEREEFQKADGTASQQHSLVAEIKKSRRSNVDQESAHNMKMMEKTDSQRDIDNENDQKTPTSTMNAEKKYPNSNESDNEHEFHKTLLTYSTEILDEIIGSIGEEKKADPRTSDQESKNFKEDNFVQSNGNDGGISVNPNEEVSNRPLERNHSVKSEGELFLNPNQVQNSLSSTRDSNSQSMNEQKMLVNTDEDFSSKPQENLNKIGSKESIKPENNSFDRQLQPTSYESERETFESPHKFDKSGKFKALNSDEEEEGDYNPKPSSAPRSTYIESEVEMSVINPDKTASDRHPGKHHNRKEENNSDLDIRSSESGREMPIKERRASRHTTGSITSATKSNAKGGSKILDDQSSTGSNLDEKGVEDYAKAYSSEWSRKPSQGSYKSGKEMFVNSEDQRGSFRLSGSKSFMPKENTRNEKDISENLNQGYNLKSKLSHNKFGNPNKERVSHHERGSAVKFTDINNRANYNSKDSDTRTSIKSSSPEKIRMVDVVLRPSHEDGSNLLTEVMRTEKTSQDSADKINDPTRVSSTPGLRKKEVIRINKELAPAVLLLLRKLEESQNSNKSASQITPNEIGIKREKSLEDSGIEQKTKHHRDPEKYTLEESNLVDREYKNHKSSVENLKHLNDNIQVEGTEFAELVIGKKSNRATSTSKLEQFCSASKCQRTCKRCSEVKKISQKEDSPHSRKGHGQEDLNIAPTLEALAEKCKNGLKVGCSLLKNFYYNQDFVRFYYFQTHPGDADLNE